MLQSLLSSTHRFVVSAKTRTQGVHLHNSVNRLSGVKIVTRAMFQGPGSDTLRQTSCNGACSRDTPLVDAAKLPELLAAVPAWKLTDNNTAISRKFVARNFMAGVRFFHKVAEVAEAEGHHPDLHLTNYREVEVKISTHAAGGLTLFDFVLAAKLDAVEVEYSPKWLQQQQEGVAAPAQVQSK
mmetsp:Transcript_11836/g.25402  ORF Transcript_11836/g.25402 Transcript_11836/m.25402 type:complete len:183 (-) Transcript_11836:678-1226(-)|eukprot:CAMPEP_0202897818 /NCGR_PEP_ID=MMETSP1392-20130828/6494_1 /ASSEMBLY_ACC=CAM_ASM_000868 /TAXON_ID=225041 /ORGANISM="Chlamydomonas chlamydogama, Strain SAG 11-48b" /LENGTH=182 /DNA_ID=CAMNT_0049583569 /DNA_START=68 /DNA_END=616 /DNA_ORIENTATION=-